MRVKTEPSSINCLINECEWCSFCRIKVKRNFDYPPQLFELITRCHELIGIGRVPNSLINELFCVNPGYGDGVDIIVTLKK